VNNNISKTYMLYVAHNKEKMLPTSIKTIYFAYFHSLLEYGIVFWGNCRKRKSVQTAKESN
jgi:hypothetical protein